MTKSIVEPICKHTKGPWTRKSIPGHLFELNSSDGPVLRIRSGMMPSLEDSYLIAAAADMLEALEECEHHVWCECGEKDPDPVKHSCAAGKVRRAILKARGKF